VRGLALWLVVLALLGLGLLIFREPPDQHFGIQEWLVNCLAGCLAFAGGWSALDLWRQRRSGRATGLMALGSGLFLSGAASFQALRDASVVSLEFVLPALACVLCAMSIWVLGGGTVASELGVNRERG
jgi:peptidoglycan/LPS O-acetylase OafA/YrhL